eukprot:COSAG06_NODE_1464_length_9373_cov_114.985874_3_plen_195_part_00
MVRLEKGFVTAPSCAASTRAPLSARLRCTSVRAPLAVQIYILLIARGDTGHKALCPVSAWWAADGCKQSPRALFDLRRQFHKSIKIPVAPTRVGSGGLQAAAFHLAGVVMSHCPASGIAPRHPPVVRCPRKDRGPTSNLGGAKAGNLPAAAIAQAGACRPPHTARNSKLWLPDQLRGLVLFPTAPRPSRIGSRL